MEHSVCPAQIKDISTWLQTLLGKGKEVEPLAK